MIAVINVADLGQRWPIAAATPHIKVETAATRLQYPTQRPVPRAQSPRRWPRSAR